MVAGGHNCRNKNVHFLTPRFQISKWREREREGEVERKSGLIRETVKGNHRIEVLFYSFDLNKRSKHNFRSVSQL